MSHVFFQLGYLILFFTGTAGHPVVLMVLDGFRRDYLSAYSTPNLDQILKDGGVLAPRLQAEFPSFTETFLTSLLTGHHTEDHGILANEVFFESLQSPLSIDDFNFWNSTRKLQTLWVSTIYFRGRYSSSMLMLNRTVIYTTILLISLVGLGPTILYL